MASATAGAAVDPAVHKALGVLPSHQHSLQDTVRCATYWSAIMQVSSSTTPMQLPSCVVTAATCSGVGRGVRACCLAFPRLLAADVPCPHAQYCHVVGLLRPPSEAAACRGCAIPPENGGEWQALAAVGVLPPTTGHDGSGTTQPHSDQLHYCSHTLCTLSRPLLDARRRCQLVAVCVSVCV